MSSSTDPPASPVLHESAEPMERLHLGTITHEGRFWDVYLEFAKESLGSESCRGRLCFIPADWNGRDEPPRTAVIIIEPSREEALKKARALDRYSLVAMLRSAT